MYINNYFEASGNCNSYININGNVNQTSGTVILNYCNFNCLNATGGANFIANNSIDNFLLEGYCLNTGITINAPVSASLYWVGGSGEWNDNAHWSVTSGGAGGACVPGYYDDVVIDNNSGLNFADSIHVGAKNIFCRNFTWTNTSTGVHFLNDTVSQNFTITGSLNLNSNVEFDYTQHGVSFIRFGVVRSLRRKRYLYRRKCSRLFRLSRL